MKCGDCKTRLPKNDMFKCFDCLEHICVDCGPSHFKDNPTKREWKRKSPNKVGYWLRLNAGGQVELKYVYRMDGELKVQWGWSGDSKFISIKNNKRKLGGFMWFGPLPSPPKVKDRYVDSKEAT